MSIINLFLKKSCIWGPNVLDWIRSVYFSLIGTTFLTFILKISSLSLLAIIIFIIGISFFFVGLLFAVQTTNRFKVLEKDYDKDTELNKKIITIDIYYANHDGKYAYQHALMYLLIFPAFICMGFAGFMMESKSSETSTEVKSKLNNIEKNTLFLIKRDSDLHKKEIQIKKLKDTLNVLKNDLNQEIHKRKSLIDSIRRLKRNTKVN